MKIIKNDNFHANRNCGNRTEKVQYIVIHYTGSEGTAANNVSYFNNGNRGASAHYFVGQNGEIREYCDPAKWYAWHCGGSLESSHHPYYGKCTNRNSIGIEICTHNNGSSWTFTADAVTAAVELTKYLMQKFGVPADRVIRHWDVTGKSCPRVPGWGAVGGSGEWNKFVARLGGAAPSVDVSLSKGDSGSAVEEMQKMLIACGYSCGKWGADGDWGNDTEKAVLAFQKDHGLSVDGVYGPKTKAALTAEYAKKNEKPVTPAPSTASYTDAFIAKVGPMAQADQAKTGILACITIAQAILESGWGRSELAVNANNLFGMKKSLSGNTWGGSTWDGKSVYSKQTKEVYASGPATVQADFRAYKDWQTSVNDHSAYLAGAKNGSVLRYAGLIGETDYKKAAQIIKNGGYATAPDYVDKLCRLVEQYGLTKYNAVQKAEKEEKKAEEKHEIRVFYPGYTRNSSPDDRQGAGCVWHDQNGKTIVIDAYEENTAAEGSLIQYLADNELYTIDFVGTHAHPDHLGGGFKILEDGRFKIENVYVYDPNSLKLAGDGTKNGRSAAGDKAYLIKFINEAKSAGANVHYVGTGDTIKCGEIAFDVYRNQPTHWSKYDTGEAWAYLNDGSICLYSKQAYYITTGDADGSQFVDEYDLIVKGAEVGHHGNNGNRTSARIYVAHGCIFAVQCNHEKGKPGSCDFTQYGSGRMREAGVKVWQLNANIYGVIKSGKAVFTQGSTVVAWDCPFGKGDGGENPAVPHYYRVRTSWADSKTQKGAYNVLANAKAEADKWNGAYGVYDWTGKEVYRPGKAPEPTPAPTPTPKPKPVVPGDGLFRVRKTWGDGTYKIGGQIGAFRNPKTAIEKAKKAGGEYEVYDDHGVPVYPDSYRTGFFRLRKSWKDAGSQISAHKYLSVGISMADSHPGYSLYDAYGRKIYPV